MTGLKDDTNPDDVTCKITLNPMRAFVGTDMRASGTISQNGHAQPNATGTFTLTAGAVFAKTLTNTCNVEADSTGVVPPERFTSSTACDGMLTFSSINPPGGTDMKPYSFIQQDGKDVMTLTVEPEEAPAGGLIPIAATATITDNGLTFTDASVVFELEGLDAAYFADGDPGARTKVVKVNGDGQAIAYIVDKKVESGRVTATGTPPHQAATSSKDIAFTAPPDLVLDLSPRTVTFEAADTGQTITVKVTDGQGNGVKASVDLTIHSKLAYFVGYNSNSATVKTNTDGLATITINSFTWCSGSVSGDATVGSSSATDHIAFESRVPAGLKIGIDSTQYATPSDPARFDGLDVTWVNASGGPATLSGSVKIAARYELNAKPWAGYGDIVFSIDGNQCKAKMSLNYSGTEAYNDSKLTVKYNDPQSNFIPQNYAPATVYMQDGHIEDVTLTMTPGPGGGDGDSEATINFGSAWASGNVQALNFIGSSTNVGSIYRNGLHQAAVEIVIALTDIFGKDLTADNQPALNDVKAAIKLVDYPTGLAYSMGGGSKTGPFSFVVVDTKPNVFEKQILGQAGADLALPVDPPTRRDDPESTVVDGIATLYYYLTFADDGAITSSGTEVGLIMDAGYTYNGAAKYNYTSSTARPEFPLVINSIPKKLYTNPAIDLVQTVTSQQDASTRNDGPYNYNGDDTPQNYQRRWDMTVSLPSGSTLFGAFMPTDLDIDPDVEMPRSTEDCAYYDVKWGGYQIKAYFLQDNNYYVSNDDYKNNKLGHPAKVETPATQSMTLDGVTWGLTAPSFGGGEIGITVVAGFGDLGKSANKWKSWKLKLVDIYGNISREFVLNLNLPQPGALLSTLNGSTQTWQPVVATVSGAAPDVVTTAGVQFSRLATKDDDRNPKDDDHAPGNPIQNMYWKDPAGDRGIIGGVPLTAVSSNDRWTITQVNAFASDGNSNNSKRYMMSAVFNGTAYYTSSSGSVATSENYYPVIGVTDVNAAAYIQLKPYWNCGAVMIFAAKDGNTPTDGTSWQWSSAEGMNTINVLVLAYQYGSASNMGLWALDVEGQAHTSVPPPPNQ